MAFFSWLLDRLPGPNRGPKGEAFVTVVARHLDDAVVRVRAAAKLDLPADAPDDALERIGQDRVIARVPGESLDAYRARLVGAWESWSWQGTGYGIAVAVGLLGYGTPLVITVRDYIIPGWPARQWAVLRLLFTGRASWGGARWGAFAWGARLVQPIEALTDAEIRAQLVPVLRQWINSRDRVRDVIIASGAPLWGRVRWGAFTWGSPGPSRRLGPAPWGTARWGRFTWGGFC